MFDVLKEKSNDWMEKIKMVEGSLEQPDLGLNEEDLQTIINNVSVVFHVAATIKFDAPIRYVLCSVTITPVVLPPVMCHHYLCNVSLLSLGRH